MRPDQARHGQAPHRRPLSLYAIAAGFGGTGTG